MTEIFLFLVGLVAGAMNAIAGGGMLLGFPALLAAGLPPLMANVTINIVVLPGSLASAFGYRKYIRRVPRQYMLLIIPCLFGAAIGATILRNTPDSKFESLVPVLILLAVMLFAFQPFLHRHLRRYLKNKKTPLQPLLLIAAAILPVAIYGGYFGAGFGFIMLAFLGFTNLGDIHKINGLKNLASVTITATSLAVLLGANLIDWRAGLAMAAGSLTGGYYGALLSQKVPTRLIRIAVIVIGVVTTAYLGLRNY